MKSQNVRKDGLSPLQRRAVAALVTSKTQRAAAASLGIAERTLARWLVDAWLTAVIQPVTAGAMTVIQSDNSHSASYTGDLQGVNDAEDDGNAGYSNACA